MMLLIFRTFVCLGRGLEVDPAFSSVFDSTPLTEEPAAINKFWYRKHPVAASLILIAPSDERVGMIPETTDSQ